MNDAFSIPITRIHLSAFLGHATQFFQVTSFDGIHQGHVIIFDLLRGGGAEESLRLG